MYTRIYKLNISHWLGGGVDGRGRFGRPVWGHHGSVEHLLFWPRRRLTNDRRIAPNGRRGRRGQLRGRGRRDERQVVASDPREVLAPVFPDGRVPVEGAVVFVGVLAQPVVRDARSNAHGSRPNPGLTNGRQQRMRSRVHRVGIARRRRS